MNKRAVMLSGGGIDSLVAAAVMHSRGWELHHLFVNYGQAAWLREQRAAWDSAHHYGASLELADVRLPWLKGSAMTNGSSEVEGAFIVPLRNVVLLSMAASYAETLGTRYIITGFDKEGFAPDTNRPMMEFLEYAFWNASDKFTNRPRIIAPLKNTTSKRQIYDLGKSVGADMGLFYSCFKGDPRPCMKCPKCLDYAVDLGDDYLARS